MTPHGILDDMDKLKAFLGPRFEETFAVKMWDVAKSCIEHAVHFELGSASPKAEHVEFANELMARGMFRLPFDEVMFTGQLSPQTAVIAHQEIKDGQMVDLTWLIVAPTIDRATQQRWLAPLGCGQLVGTDHATGAPVSLDRGTVNWKSLTTTAHHSRKTGRAWDEADHEAASEKALRIIMGGTVLLMSKDATVRVEQAPEKLNRQRAAKGKRPVAERRVVLIRPERQASYAGAAAEFASARASPRMHWRRGHFRTLPDSRVIPVAPAIINAAPDAALMPKTYKMAR